MARDWDDLRNDFPGTKEHVYLNAAAGSIAPRWVREAVTRYYEELEQSGDEHWDLWLAQMEVVRERVGRFVGAQADEIAFVTNTSDGMNILADLVSGDGPVLSDEMEIPTVTLPFIHRGAQMQFIPAIEGELRLEMFDETHAPGTLSVAGCSAQVHGRLSITTFTPPIAPSPGPSYPPSTFPHFGPLPPPRMAMSGSVSGHGCAGDFDTTIVLHRD